MYNFPFVRFLTASVIAGLIGISGLLLSTSTVTAPVSVELTPAQGIIVVGETFVTTLVIDSSIPVNVFKGLLVFNPDVLSVASIEYNTSIATLWAEEPWYSNGEGTINFTGGSTEPGGFLGSGTLITVTFTAESPGEARIALSEMQVLQHDGLGTEAELATPIDALFAIETPEIKKETFFDAPLEGPEVVILPTPPDRDLNDDGKESMADVSIFMTDLASKNLRSDLNGDGAVTVKDLSILTTK